MIDERGEDDGDDEDEDDSDDLSTAATATTKTDTTRAPAGCDEGGGRRSIAITKAWAMEFDMTNSSKDMMAIIIILFH